MDKSIIEREVVFDEHESEDESDDEYYAEWFESIRSKTGLETGILVKWPNVRELSLSTTLNETEIAPIFNGTQWAGTQVWRAAVVAIQYLMLMREGTERNADETIEATRNMPCVGPDTYILELGCGLGLPGMIIHEITNCSVVLTDMNSLVEQLKTNLDANFPLQSASRKIAAHALDWSKDGVQSLLDACPEHHNGKGFDIVLNCDCIFEPLYGKEAWQSLVSCQEALLQHNPHTMLITSLERRRADGIENYLAAMEQVAQHVERVPMPFDHAPQIEVYRAYGRKT